MARVFLACGHYTHAEEFSGAPLQCPHGDGMQERDPEPMMAEPLIFGDPVQEHLNVSLGRVVRNRSHLRRLQRDLGAQDYVPTPQMAERHKRGIAHARQNHEGRWRPPSAG